LTPKIFFVEKNFFFQNFDPKLYFNKKKVLKFHVFKIKDSNGRRIIGRGVSLNEISSMWTSFNPPITMNDDGKDEEEFQSMLDYMMNEEEEEEEEVAENMEQYEDCSEEEKGEDDDEEEAGGEEDGDSGEEMSEMVGIKMEPTEYI
jgi:hypothetical protein